MAGPELVAVLPYLRCPLCGSTLALAATALVCRRGHTFDIARQGYVNLLTGRSPAGADTAEMVEARADLLAAGHFDFLTDVVAELAVQAAHGRPSGLVIDAGAGTGHHLAAVLEQLPEHYGLALDVAKAAVRRAARVHPRAGAAVCDVWRGLPVADGCADVVLNVFAPRNPAEFHRVLRAGGSLIVVTPRPDHLIELAATVGLLRVDPDKERRLEATLGARFDLAQHRLLEHRLRLTRREAAQLVAMGPSAWHVDHARVAAALTPLAEPVEVTASVEVRRYRARNLAG